MARGAALTVEEQRPFRAKDDRSNVLPRTAGLGPCAGSSLIAQEGFTRRPPINQPMFIQAEDIRPEVF